MSFTSAGSAASSITGNNYPGVKTTATNLDLTSSTLDFDEKFYNLPHRVYEISGTYYYAINSGDWRPNDDSSFYNLNIVDSNSTFRGRAQVDSSSLEMVAILSVPNGWKATGVKVFASSSVPIDVYRIYNNNSGGSTDQLYGVTTNTNVEYNFTSSAKIVGDLDYSAMVVVHTNSTSMYVSGGYLLLEKVTSQGQ